MTGTQYKAERIGNVKGLGEIFCLCAPLNNQIETFREVGILAPYLVLPEEVVAIRLAEASNLGTRTSMTPLSVQGENTILYRGSPWMSSPEMARVAVRAHAESRYPQMQREFYEAVKEKAKEQECLEPEDRIAFRLSQKGNFQLTPEMPDTRFILGPRAEEYFKTKGHSSIKLYDLNSDSAKEVDVNYLWFNGSQCGSALSCRNGDLGRLSRAFGVLRPGKASAKNFRASLKIKS
ncbi:MAG: hypothetical protein AABX65_00765 [Nanoarchaeota archaeon]